MTAVSPIKRLSVVVAAQEAGRSLRKRLASLSAQLPANEVEIIVTDGSSGEGFGYLFGPPEGIVAAPEKGAVWAHLA